MSEEINVFVLQDIDEGSGELIDESLQDMMDNIRGEVDCLYAGDSVTLKISVRKMSRKEIDELPEFDGW